MPGHELSNDSIMQNRSISCEGVKGHACVHAGERDNDGLEIEGGQVGGERVEFGGFVGSVVCGTTLVGCDGAIFMDVCVCQMLEKKIRGVNRYSMRAVLLLHPEARWFLQ